MRDALPAALEAAAPRLLQELERDPSALLAVLWPHAEGDPEEERQEALLRACVSRIAQVRSGHTHHTFNPHATPIQFAQPSNVCLAPPATTRKAFSRYALTQSLKLCAALATSALLLLTRSPAATQQRRLQDRGVSEGLQQGFAAAEEQLVGAMTASVGQLAASGALERRIEVRLGTGWLAWSLRCCACCSARCHAASGFACARG
jgi:hypothetical protein